MTLALSTREALWFLPFVTPIALWVGWSDAARMKIPNKAVAAMLAVFLAVGLVALPLDQWLWRLAQAGVVLALTFVMSSLRLMGAGDAKFAAVMAAFVAPHDASFVILLLATLIVVTFLAHRLARLSPLARGRLAHWESWQRRDFPMGIALAPTLVLYLAAGLVWGSPG